MNHDPVWHMIPWYVNGRAEDKQREQIETHLRVCNECRNEVMAQRQILNAIASDKRIDSVPGVAFQRLWERISNEESRTPDDAEPPSETDSLAPAQAPMRARASVLTHWLAAAVIIEAIGITVLTVALRSNDAVEPPAAQFRTVTSTPATTQGDIRAVFAPEATTSELQRLLEQSGLQIVAGPTEAGVYTLASTTTATDSRRNAALASLRVSPAVRFAEPISR
jgi:hypothetical protein